MLHFYTAVRTDLYSHTYMVFSMVDRDKLKDELKFVL